MSIVHSEFDHPFEGMNIRSLHVTATLAQGYLPFEYNVKVAVPAAYYILVSGRLFYCTVYHIAYILTNDEPLMYSQLATAQMKWISN